MAKSLRSKWKRKMRAIKRETMDVKVLERMKKMMADSEKEQQLDAEEAGRKLAEKKKADEAKKATEPVEMDEPEPELETSKTGDQMEIEGTSSKLSKKKRRASLYTMRDENGQFPAWMSVKKIRRHKKILKKKTKISSKVSKRSRAWKLANSA